MVKKNKKSFINLWKKLINIFLAILIYWRWDFALFVPNLNLTFKLVLLFMVFKTGQRVDFNAKDFLVLIVGEMYSLDRDEIRVPLWATLYSLPKIPVMYPWPIWPRGPKKLTEWTLSFHSPVLGKYLVFLNQYLGLADEVLSMSILKVHTHE